MRGRQITGKRNHGIAENQYEIYYHKECTCSQSKNTDIQIPKKKLVTIVGVSGSGKSSIVYDVLYKKSANQYYKYRDIISDMLEIQTCDEIATTPIWRMGHIGV